MSRSMLPTSASSRTFMDLLHLMCNHLLHIRLGQDPRLRNIWLHVTCVSSTSRNWNNVAVDPGCEPCSVRLRRSNMCSILEDMSPALATTLDPARPVIEQLRERVAAMERRPALEPVPTLPGLTDILPLHAGA